MPMQRRQTMSKRRQEYAENVKKAALQWEDICHSLAPENLYEDGELNDYEAEQKRKSLIKRGKRLYDAGYPCPKDVYDMCDDEEALQPFLAD